MDHAVLVDIDVNAGAKIVEALDTAGVDFEVALFATFREYYDPRLVFAAKWLDPLGPRVGYEEFNKALGGKFTVWGSPQISIMKTTDPFIESLRRVFGKSTSVYGMRLGGQSFGGRYIEDGYVYRIK